MAIFDEERQEEEGRHELGEDLVDAIAARAGERIGLLKAEIERIEAAIRLKRASADSAAILLQALSAP